MFTIFGLLFIIVALYSLSLFSSLGFYAIASSITNFLLGITFFTIQELRDKIKVFTIKVRTLENQVFGDMPKEDMKYEFRREYFSSDEEYARYKKDEDKFKRSSN